LRALSNASWSFLPFFLFCLRHAPSPPSKRIFFFITGMHCWLPEAHVPFFPDSLLFLRLSALAYSGSLERDFLRLFPALSIVGHFCVLFLSFIDELANPPPLVPCPERLYKQGSCSFLGFLDVSRSLLRFHPFVNPAMSPICGPQGSPRVMLSPALSRSSLPVMFRPFISVPPRTTLPFFIHRSGWMLFFRIRSLFLPHDHMIATMTPPFLSTESVTSPRRWDEVPFFFLAFLFAVFKKRWMNFPSRPFSYGGASPQSFRATPSF